MGIIKNRLRFKISVSILLIGSIIVFVGACRRAGTSLVKEDIPLHSDAMVLLMGSFPSRVLQAVDLYNQGQSGRIIIVQEYMGAYTQLIDRGVEILGTTTQARNSLIKLGVPEDSITIVPGDARSTISEVLAIRDYMDDHPEMDTLTIVSSPSHMLRARMIFRSAFNYKGMTVRIGCSPSVYTDFNSEKWWKNKEDIQIVLTEYIKIASFVLWEKRTLKVD